MSQVSNNTVTFKDRVKMCTLCNTYIKKKKKNTSKQKNNYKNNNYEKKNAKKI